MSRRDPNSLQDGVSLITRGVNSGVPPVSLGRDQAAWAINTTFRGYYPTNRPGFIKRTLKFLTTEDGSVVSDPTLQSRFEGAIFQGASAFERRNQLVTMIGGRLFRITLDDWEVLDISTSDLNPSNRYRAWFCEAEDFLIAQDGQSAPWIYDGATTKRSDAFGMNGPRQIPAGTAMCYSNGRILTCLQDNRQFIVGDIVGGDSGTQAYSFRDAVLYVTENDTLNGGGSFSVPINAGELTAFRPVAQVDTSTGQGPTQVFTTGGIFSLNAPTQREAWADTNFPIGTVSMVSNGALSDRATINVNGDIWMRSLDGVRSFIVARRDFDTWVNAPMSQEVLRALAKDDKSLLGHASAAVFDNRLLMTCNPYRSWDHGIAHRGLVVIDFAPVAYLNNRVTPVWEGLWTGLQVLQIISGTFGGIERCFVFALSNDLKVELWELSRDAIADYNGSEDVSISWSIEYASCNFPRGIPPFVPGDDLQKLQNGLLYVDSISGTVVFDVDYRMDQDPCWHDWHEWTVCAVTQVCSITDCTIPSVLQQQYRKPFRLPSPAEDCDPVTNKTLNVGAEAQPRINVTGHCRIKRLDLFAYDQQEDVSDICQPNEVCQTVACDTCENDFAYAIPSPSPL